MKNLRVAFWIALALGCSSAIWADPVSGTLYYTTFAGAPQVHQVNYNFNGITFSLTGNTDIGSTIGADGLLFAPDGNLLVGGQGNGVVNEIPKTGPVPIAVQATGTGSYHLALSSDAANAILYSMWNGPGGGGSTAIGAIQLSGGGLTASTDLGGYTVLCAAGSPGCSKDVRGVILDTHTGTWYYGTASDVGPGDFGTVVFDDVAKTATLTPILTGVPAHGVTFDPFTNDIIFSQGNQIDQFDPTSGTIVSSLFGAAGDHFDQSAVDGKGHLFVASNNGNLEFADYASTGRIGTSSFTNEQFLNFSLDDVAPLSGLGGNSVPEPGSILLLGSVLGGLICYRVRRKSSHA